MDNKIDYNYFWGELKIPNLKVNDSSLMGDVFDDVSELLDKYIKKYQKKYFEEMFGATYGVEGGITDELIASVIDEEAYISPIANYVYYWFMRNESTLSTPSGEKSLTSQNTMAVSNNEKLVKAWNDMVDLNIIVHETLEEAETIGDLNYNDDILPDVDFNDDIFNGVNIWGL